MRTKYRGDVRSRRSDVKKRFSAAIRARIDSWYPAKDPDEEQDDE